MKRMAPQKPAGGGAAAAPDAVRDQGQSRVFGACRREATVAAERRRQERLVSADQRDGGAGQPAHKALRGRVPSASFNSAINVGNARSRTGRFAITMSATPVGAALRAARKASRR